MEGNHNSLAEYLLGGPPLVFDRDQKDMEARMNLLISPTDAKWKQVHHDFHRLLESDQTLGQILSSQFSASEARLFVSSDRPDVKAIQDENTERYESLLRGRFRHVARDLPSKLTMMYFGLPVAPWDDGFTSLLEELEKRKPEDPRWDVKPPLHFLTAHKERNWGDDHLRGREDDVGPLPVPVPVPEEPILSLRGGDGDSDDANIDPERLQEELKDLGDSEMSDGYDESEHHEDIDFEERDAHTMTNSKLAPQECLDFVPETEVAVRHLDADPEGWVNLFGFQGVVPFVPDNWTTFTAALRRLLALLPEDRADFSLLCYNTQTRKIVEEIPDCLPLTQKSPAMAYISTCFERNWRDAKRDSTFFVKLRGEKTPPNWQPPEGSLGTSVIRIKCAVPDAPDNENPPLAYCYVSIPKPGDAAAPSHTVRRPWGVNRYSPYFRTALEVLLGPMPSTRHHHCFSQICAPSLPSEAEPCTYGISSASAHHLKLLSDLGPDESAELKQMPIPDDGIAFVLPGYCPTSKSAPYTVAKKHDPPRTSPFEHDDDYPTAAWTIHSMVSKFLGKEGKLVKHIRVYPGDATLSSESMVDQKYFLAPLSDTSVGDRSAGTLDAVFKDFVAHHGPVLLLVPDWQDADTFMYGAWTGEAPKDAQQRGIPGLASTVKELRDRVHELLRLTLDPSHPLRCCDLESSVLSIQGVRPDGTSTPQDAIIDLPCFFIGPQTGDDEWSRIRAMISTRGVVVDVLDAGQWDWASRLSQGNFVWGPRYGHFEASINKPRSRRQLKDPLGQQEIRTPQRKERTKETPKRYTPHVPPGETGGRTSGFVMTPPTIKSVNPGLFGSVQSTQSMPRGFDPSEPPLDPDDRRRAWASQPSIFDGHNLRTWPSNSAFRIPSSAPPIEHMLRISSNVPVVSKAVMTPTEQAHLQRCFFEMRNLNLGRVSKCSYAGCHFTYKHGEEHLLSHHLASMHLAQKCMWCDDPLYQHWNEQQRDAHLRHAHRDRLLETLNVTSGTIIESTGHGTVSIPLKRTSRHLVGSGLAMLPRAGSDPKTPTTTQLHPVTQQFCGLCGRDREHFSSDAEQRYHDRNCRPGIFNHAKCEFCSKCGDHCWLTKADAALSGMAGESLQSCNHNRADPTGKHCRKCGFMMDALPADGQHRHALTCKGYAATPGRFCSLCGISMLEGDSPAKREANAAEHMRQCFAQLLAGRRPEPEVLNDLIAIERREPERVVQLSDGDAREEEDAQVRGRRRRQPQEDQPDDHVEDVEMSEARPIENPEPQPQPEPLAEGSKRNPAKPKATALEKPRPAVQRTKKTQDHPVDPNTRPTEPETTDAPEPQDKRRKGKAKRGRRLARGEDDGDFEAEEDDDDEEEGREDVAGDEEGNAPRGRGRRWKRRATSPDWNKQLGPEDPNFEPKGDFHCSKCFRKAPTKAHKRSGSPLGIKKEIEMHYDKTRCCKIRRGVGSAENLPNRSGWIPANLMPKPLSTLRKTTLKKFPAYARTLYPLHKSNANGTYWRSDPNHDDNKDWWDIPWPAYHGKAPFPGWIAPDAPEDEVRAWRKRQEFQLRAEADPSYEYVTDDEVDELAESVVPEENPASPTLAAGRRRKRKRARSVKPKAAAATAGVDAAADVAADAAADADADDLANADQDAAPSKKTKRTAAAENSPAKRRKTD